MARKETKIYLFLKFMIQVNLFVGLAIAVYRLDWLSIVMISLIILVTLIPLRLGTRYKFFIPAEIELLAIAIVYASLYLGELGDYYERFWWWDLLLHSSSGVLFAVFGFLSVLVLNEDPKAYLRLSPLFVSLMSFSFSIMTGTLWEIFEFTMDQLFGTNMQKSGLVDTMSDLIVVCGGAFFMSLFGYAYMRFGYRSIATRWFEHFVEDNSGYFDGKWKSGQVNKEKSD